MAAVEQFLRDTVPPPAPADPRPSPWVQAARDQAVEPFPPSWVGNGWNPNRI